MIIEANSGLEPEKGHANVSMHFVAAAGMNHDGHKRRPNWTSAPGPGSIASSAIWSKTSKGMKWSGYRNGDLLV
jgi:hypothetical protein